MSSAVRRAVTAVLLLAITLLAIVTWHQITRHIDTSPIRAAGSSGHADTGVTTAISSAEIYPDAVSEILERPLFNVGRRPFPQATASSQQVDAGGGEARSDSLTVVGTLRWGSRNLALIRAASNPFANWIDIGGTVDGWTLKGIERDFIVVERASRKVQIPIVSKPGQNSSSKEN